MKYLMIVMVMLIMLCFGCATYNKKCTCGDKTQVYTSDHIEYTEQTCVCVEVPYGEESEVREIHIRERTI
jgi:hypothetical protein